MRWNNNILISFGFVAGAVFAGTMITATHGSDILPALSGETAPAWVQAVGSVLAILAAVAVPAWQRQTTLRDQKVEKDHQDKSHLQRLVAGLRAEIHAAVAAAKRRQEAAVGTLAQVTQARAAGQTIIERASPRPGSFVTTDAIIYRAVSSELGRLPPELIRRIVSFYALSLETDRIVEMSISYLAACQQICNLMPRARMNGEVLIAVLDNWEAAEFSPHADLRVAPEKAREIADRTGYPLAQVLGERELQL